MREREHARVQAQPRRHRTYRRQRVEVIAQDRMAELTAVHAQLVAATGARQELEPRDATLRVA